MLPFSWIPEVAPHEIDPAYKDICLNGKEKSSLTLTQQLEEFKKGPCSPFMFANGLFMAKLRVVIDCEELKREDPETFSSCYWNSCTRDLWPIFRKPNTEYDLGVLLNSWQPMGILNPWSGDCFWNIQKHVINYDAKHPGEVYKKRAGLRVTYMGDTPETHKSSQCGFEAHRDVFATKGWDPEMNGYRKLMDTLMFMGYTPGLTYQPMPYMTQHNWETHSLKDEFLPTLKRLNKMTGKKVVVAGHSMGNIQVYSNLLKIDQKTKDELIQHYNAMFPPMIGDEFALKMAFGGTLNEVLPVSLTLKKWSAWVAAHNWMYGYWPANVWENHKEEKYMKQVKKHMAYEKNPTTEKKGFSWFPSATEKCYKNIQYGPECSMGLEDADKARLMTIKGKDYYRKDAIELLETHSINPDVKFMVKLHQTPLLKRFQAYENPGVPIVLYYNISWKVNNIFTYNKSPAEERAKDLAKDGPKHWTELNPIMPDKKEPIRGDAAVSATGQILPYLKWADDFDRGTETKATKHPVKFVDYCSQLQNRSTPFDDFKGDKYESLTDWSFESRVESLVKFAKNSGLGKNSSQGTRISKNEYIGLYCKCTDTDARKVWGDVNSKISGHSCDHGNFAEDDIFLYFYSNSLVGNQKSSAIGESYFKSEEEAQHFVDTCKLRLG